jgi:hypothetical protein
MKRNALIVFACLAAPACVLNPTWGDEPTRRDPIDFSGMASRASAPVRIQAWNYHTSAFETVASFTGTTRRYASDPDIYGWSRVGVRLPDRNWVPPGAPCSSGGMANLRVLEDHTDGTFTELATFTQDGEECLYDEIADGAHPVAAGNTCKYVDERIVLFAPPPCVPALLVDASPPAVSVRIQNTTQAYQRSAGESPLTATGISRTSRLSLMSLARDLNGAVKQADVVGSYTVTCRHTASGITSSWTQPVASRMTRPVTAGALTDVAIETTWLVDVPSIVATGCTTGYTFDRIEGSITASGTNVAGAVTTSPLLTFSI